MIAMPLSEAARALAAEMAGENREFRGCSTDTRTIQEGELFIALRGAHFDAHEFIAQAAAKNAAAVLVERRTDAFLLPALMVDNTQHALGRLAQYWREKFTIPFVAVTGSNGKTTVKEMLASIFMQSGPVLATRGNLNNEIGVPLTLFRLGNEHLYAVIEMGANHAGEIAHMCAIAKPDVAAVTLCAPAHLEGFGSIEGVAKAKGEIFTGLSPGGTAVINADDDYAGLWRNLAAGKKQICFGLHQPAEVTALQPITSSSNGSHFILQTPAGQAEVQLPLPGRHNIMNALAASACAFAAGLTPDRIAAGLAAMQGVSGRLWLKQGRNVAKLIDDTYNANPSSLRAAIEVLSTYPGERWLILGDMGELGPTAEQHHYDIGVAAKQAGIDHLYTLGTLSRHATEGYGAGAQHFTELEDLLASLTVRLNAHLTILVKGSRSMRMERVINAWEEKGEN